MRTFLDVVAYGSVRILVVFFSTVPLQTALRIGAFFGRCLFYFSKRRHTAYADLKSAFGSRFNESERWRIVRDHYAHLGQTAVEVMRFPLLDQDFIRSHIRIHHSERFYEAIRENRGVILLTAHFGNWELLQIISGILGKPIHVLARNQKHSRLNEFLNELRQSHGSVAMTRGIGVRGLLRALRRKELIGVVGDQDAGKYGGVIVSLLGRKTTVPTGAFDLARRTGAPVLPCFMVRVEGPCHEIFVEEPIRCREDAEDLEPLVRRFVGILEDLISRFPSQWLWSSKRWKHTWTKRLLILSDEKTGHVKQSEALARKIMSLDTQYGRPGMEYPTEKMVVRFKSEWHKRFFPFFALFFIPWAQGRLRWLSVFFTEETQKEIRVASADFILSSGSSLIPLNLCLARECRAKSFVLMRPSFPFNFFRYDLAVVPAHDKGLMPSESFRTLLVPSQIDPDEFESSASKLEKELRDVSRIKLGIFLGGPTRRYRMNLGDIENVIAILERISDRAGDYLLTTSRRTPACIARLLKLKRAKLSSCQMLVIASEDQRSEVVSGMMALADILIVTEDSISMISEAVSAGKKVIVLSFGTNGLPAKHRRFRDILAGHRAVVIAQPEDLEEKILNIGHYIHSQPQRMMQEEHEALQRRLQEIL
jgi:KDO2-lipid IV(A) lauroyltransferase